MVASTPNMKELPKVKTAERPIGQWMLALRRLRRHRLAMIGFMLLTVVIVLSIFSSWIAPYSYDEQDYMRLYDTWMSPGEPGQPLHWMGTDGLGRDTLTRILYAGRISLLVALVITVLNILIGTLVGSLAGYFGSKVDAVLMAFTDLMLTLPNLPLLLILSASLRQFTVLQEFLGSNLSVIIIIIVLSGFGWMQNARLVRAAVLSLRETEFVEASRAMGAGGLRIILSHLIPNALAPIIVSATLGFGAVVISESALSFLGFGVMPPVPTWGNMLNEARAAPQIGYTLFLQTLAPGLCIFITVLSVNFIGDGLRDALDPRLKL